MCVGGGGGENIRKWSELVEKRMVRAQIIDRGQIEDRVRKGLKNF